MSDTNASGYFISQKHLFLLRRSVYETSSFLSLSADDHLNYLPWLLLTAVCLLALVILTFVCMCKYVNASKKVGMPSSLVRLFHVSSHVSESQ